MITWNIIDNLAYWQPSTFVQVGGRRRYVDSMYECITAGATGPDPSQGPTGTDANIVDGNVHWKYLCHVDYMSLEDWHDNTGSSLSDDGTVQIWRNIAPGCGDGEVVLQNFHFEWDKTTNGHTMTITAAPGESFADNIDTNALWYNPYIGVAYNIQSSTSDEAFGVSSGNLIISRLQFRTQVQLFSLEGSNSEVVGCICQQDGAPTFSASGTNCNLINCLVVDLIPADQLTGITAKWGQYQSTGSGTLLNTTFLSYTPDASMGGFLLRPNPSGATLVRNCLAFGATDGVGNFAIDQNFGGSVSYDHNASDDVSIAGVPDGGSNAFGYAAHTIFANPSGDLRLLSTAPVRGAGIASDLIPGAVDITGFTRGGSWDIGAWEYRTMVPRYRRLSGPDGPPSLLPPGRIRPQRLAHRVRTQ